MTVRPLIGLFAILSACSTGAGNDLGGGTGGTGSGGARGAGGATGSGGETGAGGATGSGGAAGAAATDGGSGTDGGGSGVAPPSCAPGGPGMTDCGPGQDSCCTSLPVAGGTYFRTYRNNGSGPTGTGDPATISNFRLDKYLVTVGRFRQFAAAWTAGWRPAAGAGKHAYLSTGGLASTAGGIETGWDATWNTGKVSPTTASLTRGSFCDAAHATWTAAATGGHENLPINCVNWYDSYAFCLWDGGFLPSEAEWEYAGAGGTEQRQYPWGSTAPGMMNQYAIYGVVLHRQFDGHRTGGDGDERRRPLGPARSRRRGLGVEPRLEADLREPVHRLRQPDRCLVPDRPRRQLRWLGEQPGPHGSRRRRRARGPRQQLRRALRSRALNSTVRLPALLAR